MAQEVADGADFPRILAVAWGTEVEPQRGPKRELTHERIVAAAIEMADEQGLEAVTMQRLAASLGYSTMALYRYVGSKDELYGLMQDAVVGELDAIAIDASDWRQGILDWAQYVRSRYVEHPWLLDITIEPLWLLMPGNLRLADRALRVLEALGLPSGEALDAMSALSLLVRGFEQIARDFTAAPVTLTPAGLATLAEVVTPGKFPAIAPLIAGGQYVMTVDAHAAGEAGDDAPGAADGGTDSAASASASSGPASATSHPVDPDADSLAVLEHADIDQWGSGRALRALLDGLEQRAKLGATEREAAVDAHGAPEHPELTPAHAVDDAERRLAEAIAARDAAKARVKAAERQLREAERAIERAKAARAAAREASKLAAKAAAKAGRDEPR